MVDVSSKKKTVRVAKARAIVEIGAEIVEKIKHEHVPKGDVLEVARIAGIMSAKKTPGIIPLCHTIAVENVSIDFILKKDSIVIESRVKATAKTGVEMEALAAVAVAGLTIYDMCKMFNKSIKILSIELLEKRGGKSGFYRKC